MAIATDGINIAYNGTYASKILLEPLFVSDMMEYATVIPNVKYKMNMNLAGRHFKRNYSSKFRVSS